MQAVLTSSFIINAYVTHLKETQKLEENLAARILISRICHNLEEIAKSKKDHYSELVAYQKLTYNKIANIKPKLRDEEGKLFLDYWCKEGVLIQVYQDIENFLLPKIIKPYSINIEADTNVDWEYITNSNSIEE